MNFRLLLIGMVAVIGFSCQKEKSNETISNAPSACLNEYAGNCKLLQIVYEPTSQTGTQKIVSLTYTGSQITLLDDNDDQRKVKYNSDGKISSIEYYDKTSSLFNYAIEKMSYNSAKQVNSILVLYNVGNNQFDSLYRTDFQYTTTNQLAKKTFFEYDDSQKKWKESENYLYTYNNFGLATTGNYSNLTTTPTTSFQIPISYSDSCNSFQKVYPQMELLDYIGQEDLGGFSILLLSRKLVSAFLNQPVTYTFNNKNAPTEIRINGQLIVSYIYNCP